MNFFEDGRRYWEGGGVRRGGIEGDDCNNIIIYFIILYLDHVYAYDYEGHW